MPSAIVSTCKRLRFNFLPKEGRWGITITPACAFEFANATFILLVWSLLVVVVVVVAAFVVFVDIFDPFLMLLCWVGLSSLLPGTGSLTGENSFVA